MKNLIISILLVVITVFIIFILPCISYCDATTSNNSTDDQQVNQPLYSHSFEARLFSVMLCFNKVVIEPSFNTGVSVTYAFNFAKIKLPQISSAIMLKPYLFSLYLSSGIAYGFGTQSGLSIMIDGGIGIFNNTIMIGFGCYIVSNGQTWDIFYGIVLSSVSLKFLEIGGPNE